MTETELVEKLVKADFSITAKGVANRLIKAGIVEVEPEIDPATHDPRDNRPWPPSSASLWVYPKHGVEFPAVSLGGGLFITQLGTFKLLDYDNWSYIRPPWPWDKNIICWWVNDAGEMGVDRTRWEVGDKVSYGTVIHVEYRGKT